MKDRDLPGGVETTPELEGGAKAPKLGGKKMKRGNVRSRIFTYGTLEMHSLTTGVSRELRREGMNAKKCIKIY